jgi:hypothetical protein
VAGVARPGAGVGVGAGAGVGVAGSVSLPSDERTVSESATSTRAWPSKAQVVSTPE